MSPDVKITIWHDDRAKERERFVATLMLPKLCVEHHRFETAGERDAFVKALPKTK